MNNSLRLLMGIAVLFILVPALALTLPEGLGSLNPWSDDESGGQGMESLAIAAGEAGRTFSEPSKLSPSTGSPALVTERLSQFVPTDPEIPSDFAAPANTTETSAPAEAGAETTPGTASEKPRAAEGSATTQPAPKASGGGSPVVTGTITGTACPCKVTGTVELKGNISLQGDIMVMGGTLVARPGVNVDGNGFQIMFMDGGNADFQGSKVFTWSNNGANQNLKRDINFDDMRRIMFHMGAGKSTLRYFTISNSGNAGVLGDYPLHFHLNGNSTRGTLVEGVVIVNGQNHAFVPHGSHGITFRDTIAKTTTGDAYWWDPPGSNGACAKGEGCDPVDNSNDIMYDHALVDGVFGGRGVAGFVLGAGQNPTVKNSAAININSSNPSKRFCTGFLWPEFTNGSARGANTVWTFKNNYSFSPSGCDGIHVWQNTGVHVVTGFSGGEIDHGAYSNEYVYENINVTNVLIHAAGWKMVNGHAGDVVAAKHRSEDTPTVQFDNVTVDSFTIRNAGDSGNIPGIYVFNGSGLSCADIVYDSVVPGTKVILDGSEC